MEDPAVTAFEIAWEERRRRSRHATVPKSQIPESSKIQLVFPNIKKDTTCQK